MGVTTGSSWAGSQSAGDALADLRQRRVLGIPEDWFYLLVGLPLAPLLVSLPFLGLVGWFFGALVHEMGHTAAFWFVGMSAVPALGITAQAATMHGEQQLLLALMIWGAMVYWGFQRLDGLQRNVTLALVALLYPVLCLSDLREAWFLVGGHLGELAVGAIFLARARSGGFSHGVAERALYSILAWFLVGRTFLLGSGLALSQASRDQYASNGSYGLRNDFLRLADHFSLPLQLVGSGVALVSLALAPALMVCLLRRAARD